MVFYTNNSTTPPTSLGYALTASATATATGGGSSASLTLTVLRNTTTAASFPNGLNDTVTVGATTVPVAFTASQEGTATAAFETVVVSNGTLNIDNGLIVSASSGAPTSPIPNVSQKSLTDVTLTLQDPSTMTATVIFTISAGSAVYTSFSGDVTPSAATAAGLNTLVGGGDWENNDVDLVLDNVSFTIGNYVSFTATSIDLQHSVVSGVTTDSFNFSGATVALLINGQPMVTLTGSPVFHYTTGSTDPMNPNGFILDSFSNPGFSFLDPTTTLGPLTLMYSTDPVSFHDFSFSLSGQLSTTVMIGPVTAMIGTTSSPVSATVDGLSGTFTLQLGFDLGDLTAAPSVTASGFTLTAASVTANVGSYLTLSATGTTQNPLSIDPTAGATQNLISFATLSATLDVGSFDATGTASNFAIEGNGSFLAEPHFGVSIALGTLANDNSDTSGLGFPSWLPLTGASVALSWPNFNTSPTVFDIDLSATIANTFIPGLTFSGTLSNVVLDVNASTSPPSIELTSIGALGITVGGSIFGGTVKGSLIGGLVRFDADGNVVDGLGNIEDVDADGNVTDTTTPAVGSVTSVFYAGIQAGFNFLDMTGFNIEIGLSELGPLDVYIESDTPVPIGPTTLVLSSFNAGIEFNATFPNIVTPASQGGPLVSDALKLNGPAFTAPDSLTAAQWQAQLQSQVVNQYRSTPPGGTFAVPNTFIIEAGVSLYDEVATADAMQITGNAMFDSSGDFLVIGTLTAGGGNVSVGAKIYADLSLPAPTLLFIVQDPAQPNVDNTPATYSLYGFVTFAETSQGFQITIAGEADFNVLNSLKAEVTATLTLTFSSNSFNVTVSDGALYIPAIQSSSLGTADGSLTIENANGTIEIWGGLLLTLSATALNAEGIYIAAQANVELNTTDVVQTVTLSNGTLSLEPESFSLLVNGVASFELDNQVIFELDGTLAMQISATSLSIFVQAQLLLGPSSNSPILTFNASGLIYVQLVNDDSDPSNPIDPGFAAKLALTLGAGAAPSGITFGENWLLVTNTTEGTITYTIPSPVPTNPPSPSVPTVLGPDYSSSNPLALTSYETDTASVVSGGTGYHVGNILTVSGGTFTTASTLMVSSIGANGAITGVTVTSGGDYTVQPANPASASGGSGSGATFNITRTLVIPNGPPAGELTDYSDWTPPADEANSPYFIVLGRGSITVANVFTLSGEINIDAAVINSAPIFTLDENATMALNVDGNTIFNFTSEGGIQISTAGVAAVVEMQRSGGVPGGLGFNLSATYLLELNTTDAPVTIDAPGTMDAITLPKEQSMIQATGDLTLLGNVVDLYGTFNITASATSLTVGVAADVTFLVPHSRRTDLPASTTTPIRGWR